MAVTTFRFHELTLECVSRAGDETWLRICPPGLAIDVGRGTPKLRGVETVFLTHGHLDHVLGVAFLLSLRPPSAEPALTIVCPDSIAAPLDRMLRAAGELDGEAFRYNLRPAGAGDRIEVGSGLWMEAFSSRHVGPGLGYHLLRQRHRLRADLTGLDGREIARRRRAGEAVDEIYEERWVSVTGDTAADVFEQQPELYESRILVTECTFVDPEHRERAARFGHIHLEDLVERRERFANRFLVLGHLSGRYQVAELRQAVEQRLQPLTPDVLIVGEPDWEATDEQR